jgi:hypothetical protein
MLSDVKTAAQQKPVFRNIKTSVQWHPFDYLTTLTSTIAKISCTDGLADFVVITGWKF